MSATKKPLVVTVTGIRPDFIRMSEVFKKLDESSVIDHIMIHTGQHYDEMLSNVFFREMNIRMPDYNLECGGGNHFEQLSKLTSFLLNLLIQLKPDLVVYLGDSNSVLTAPSVRKHGFKVAHIEAGMRSGDMRMLEEINRKVCDSVSNLLFVYQENYKQKLFNENIKANVHVVGNTIVEPLNKLFEKENITTTEENLILVDIHRPENSSDDRIKNIMEFISFVKLKTNYNIQVLNFPRFVNILDKFKDKVGFNIIPLMSYSDFIKKCAKCNFIISDSGTAQEELALINKKVLVPRDFTERPESIENNCSKLIDFNNRDKYEDLIK